MNSAEIRETYLRFFEERGHTRYPSARLVPDDDPSLLFTGAGMNQVKDMFMGVGNLPFSRATTTQKCLRLPDLDNVGRTSSHHTFFEMLGNFSFGDYFKQEAIVWADELMREGFGFDRKQLAISVYKDDDESAEMWQKLGYARDRIFRYDEEDNFWPSQAPSKGPNGPCGPCSEIYFDRGERADDPPKELDPGSSRQRFVEVWNLVFTQYERRDGGELVPLPRRNIDTGMGLERLVRVLQGKTTNFDTDLFAPLLGRLQELASRPYGESDAIDRPMRRISDHVRAVAFCIMDGVLPSNERQGYVVRKLVRRAVADGLDSLGLDGPFLGSLVPCIAEVAGMADVFPDLVRLGDKIRSEVEDEERKFLETYERGRQRLTQEIEGLEARGSKTLPGDVAFFLWDTAGFPLDLTRRVLDDHDLDLDEDGYERAMEKQRETSRRGSNIQAEIFSMGPLKELKAKLPETEFIGFDSVDEEAVLTAMLRDGELVETATEGEEVVLIFPKTPFYSESGGQVGDRGEFAAEGFRVRISDTVKGEGFALHRGAIVDGSIAVGQHGRLTVDASRHRDPTRRNHTATHLAHWALRRVLGDSVEQKGSLVDPERLRFDFSLKGGMTDEQIEEVERLVNQQIVKNLDVAAREMTFDEAVGNEGAMALFGEKYGDVVRVVRVDDPDPERRSVELCGGTHVTRTGDIGAFKIIAESGVAAGVRRIEAVTGHGALAHIQHQNTLLKSAATVLRAAPDEVPQRIESMQNEVKKLRKEIDQLSRQSSGNQLDELIDGAQEVGGIRVIVGRVEGDTKALMGLVDGIKAKLKGQLALALLGVAGKKVAVVVSADDAAQGAGVHAGNLCKKLCGALRGGGGGNPALGRGQGSDASAVDATLEQARTRFGEMLQG